MAGKKSSEKDPNEVSNEDLQLVIEAGEFTKQDNRYFTDPNDPRLKKRCQEAKFQRLLRNLSAEVKRAQEEQLSEHKTSEIKAKAREILFDGEKIVSDLDKRFAETGTATVLSKEERDAEAISLKQYVKIDRTITDTDKPKKQKKRVRRKTKAVTGAIPQLGEADLLNRLSAAEKEVAEKEKELEEIKKEETRILKKVQNTVGPSKAPYFTSIEKSIEQLFMILDQTDKKRKVSSETAQKFANILDSIKKITDKGSGNYFHGYEEYLENNKDREDFFILFGGKALEDILIRAGEDNVQIKNKPGQTFKPQINSNDLVPEVISRLLISYDKFLKQLCSNKYLSESQIKALIEELKTKKTSQTRIDEIVANAKGLEFTETLENRRRIDGYPKLERDLARLQKKLEGKQGKKQDVAEILKELLGIGKALEGAGQYITFKQDPNVSSSKVLDLPEELGKIKVALTDIVIELAGRQEETVDLRETITALKKKISTKRKPSSIVDPILRKLYKKFSTVKHVLEFYAKESGFTVEPLEKINYQAENASIQVINNYFKLLDDLREVIKIDISGKEKAAQEKFRPFVKKLSAKFKKKKDILRIRKGIEELIKEEEKKITIAVIANNKTIPKMLKSSNIDEKTLLETTKGYEKADANCLASYVNPIYRSAKKLDLIPERQKELAERYNYEDFATLKLMAEELKDRVENEKKYFKDARKIASIGKNKRIISNSDAKKFIKLLSEMVEEADKDETQIQEEQQEILKESIIPTTQSYDEFKEWIYKAHTKLEAIGDPTKDRKKLCKLVQNINPEQGNDYQESIQYLKEFVNDTLFEEASVNLSYFSELSDVFTREFYSGQELIQVIDEEKKQFENYLKLEERRIKQARKILPPNGDK